jgi:hypothetical protein
MSPQRSLHIAHPKRAFADHSPSELLRRALWNVLERQVAIKTNLQSV